MCEGGGFGLSDHYQNVVIYSSNIESLVDKVKGNIHHKMSELFDYFLHGHTDISTNNIHLRGMIQNKDIILLKVTKILIQLK